jgi:phosphatidylserine/phosphatidylglycerophosphate/cardiolipin synthase-like enzyme
MAMVKSMRWKILSTVLLAIGFLALAAPIQSQERPSPCPSWAVYFSPNGHCTQAIIQELDKAKTSILMQAYSFTSAPIAKSLLEAHKRGVKVEVILDKSNLTEKYSSVNFLVNNGIPTRIDAAHAIAHNKVMIIDGETLVTGSFNRARGRCLIS